MSKNSYFNSSIFLKICLVGMITCLLLSCSSSQQLISNSSNDANSNSRPNLLIIMADQWRGSALGFLGEEPVMTPHLDKLASNSLVLTNFITNYPLCSPSRAMLMSGQYPFTDHVWANVNSASAPYGVELKDSTITWSDILSENGYSLGYIGKWHLTSPHPPYIPTYNNKGKIKWNEWTPPDRRHGFDFWYSYGTYDKHMHPMYWSTNAGRMDYHYVNEWEPKEDVDKAIAFLENKNGKLRKKGQPFGLMVSMNPPHTWYKQIPDRYYNLYKDIPIDSLVNAPNIPPTGTKWGDFYRNRIRYYYAAITGVDEQIGRLIATLKRTGLYDNTIILFISDHGDCLGRHSKNHKNNIYEEALRVPFILHWEGHIKPRIDSLALLSMINVYPTLMDMMGLKSEIPSSVQGKSWASYLLTGEGGYPTQQFFMGHVPYNGSAERGFRGVRTQRYTLAYKRNKKGVLKTFLFDRKRDPFELNNVYKQRPQIVDSLTHELINILRHHPKDPFIKYFK